MARSTYLNAGRLDAKDRGFSSVPVRSGLLHNANGDRLPVQYNSQDETLQIMSVFSYFAQLPDRLDAQRFRFGFRPSGHASNVQHVDDI